MQVPTQLSVSEFWYFSQNCSILYSVQNFTFGNTEILKYRAQYRKCPPLLSVKDQAPPRKYKVGFQFRDKEHQATRKKESNKKKN